MNLSSKGIIDTFSCNNIKVYKGTLGTEFQPKMTTFCQNCGIFVSLWVTKISNKHRAAKYNTASLDKCPVDPSEIAILLDFIVQKR